MPANSGRAFLKALVVLALLAGAGLATAYFLRPIAKVGVVGRGDTASIIPGSVVVEAERESPIASEIEGKVTKSDLVPGQRVKEGDVLFELDTRDIDLEIAQAQAEFDAAGETAKIAAATAALQLKSKTEEFEAAEREHKAQRLADIAFEKAQRDFDVAKQEQAKAAANDKLRIATLETALKVAQRKKEKMTINAPFDGTITQVLAHNNDLVGAKQPLANIIAATRRVKAKISEENFAAVEVGMKAKITFLGYRDQVFLATVTQKLPTAEPDTQRYIAYLKVDGIEPEKLLPNLTGEVGIIVGEHKNVVRVPRIAMRDGYAFVVENGRMHEHKLDPGYVDYNWVEVKSGVKEGDVIIVEDTDSFHDGQRVRTQAVTAAP
jgi:RND family efflux transporter MFP subunit